MKANKTDYIVQTVASAFDILEQFNGEVDEIGVSELSRTLNLHKNKVFRLLATLKSRNYIEQNAYTGNYRLGLNNLLMGQAFSKQMGLLRQASPVQESLTRECNETSYVAIMKDFQIICLNAVESDLPVRIVPRVGEKLPIYCTASGKVIASGLSEEALGKFIRETEFKKYTNNTIKNLDELVRQLRNVKTLGYAIDNEELDAGVKCVGAPIRDFTNHIVGSVSLSGPSARFAEDRIVDELIPLVKKSATEISIRLGFS